MRNLKRNNPNLFTDHRFIVLALALFAFGMSAYLSQTVFERLPHLEDEVAYLYQARVFARGDIVIDSPETSRVFWQPFIVDRDGNRFSKYTPGWSAQLAVGILLGEYWVINAFFAALTVALTYRLGREIFNPQTGLIAAALFAFSPMALLLNATLMSHTSALFWTTLFLYAYWRLERGRHALRWGLLAGLALGALVATRPLTAVAIGLPVIVWSVIRLVRAFALTETTFAWTFNPTFARAENLTSTPRWGSYLGLRVRRMTAKLPPLIALSVVTLLLSAAVPIYNRAAVGDPLFDLYRLVWDYDRIGFGAGQEYGRSGHTLTKAFNHGRFDLSLTAADLFGWQLGTITDANGAVLPDIATQLTTEADYWLRTGLSWVLLPFGLLVGFRRKSPWVILWFLVLYGWMRFAFDWQGGAQMTNPVFAWLWLAVAFAWLLAPFLVLRRRTEVWTWILAAVTLSLLGSQMTYWIGSQRYSTRYYYEALTAVCLLSALPIAWLVRWRTEVKGLRAEKNSVGRSETAQQADFQPSPQSSVLSPLLYAVFAALLVYSFITYSLPRIGVLRGFNHVNRERIAEIEARREPGRDVLVIVNGTDVRWRAFGALMAVTSPYLDSPIVAAWNFQDSSTLRDDIIARFPDRQVIDLRAQGEESWFDGEVATAP
ncbi:MAG: glycosyltransferase family 39 protein [Anaerolineae bacterium]|nr:glycosyltransferase family 39 protein [Anaerolineae bacterium]